MKNFSFHPRQDNVQLLKMFKRARYLQPFYLFSSRWGVTASKYYISGIRARKSIREFLKQYPEDQYYSIVSSAIDVRDDKRAVSTAYVEIAPFIAVYYNSGYDDVEGIHVLHHAKANVAELNSLLAWFNQFKLEEEKGAKIHLLMENSFGNLDLTPFRIKEPNVDLQRQYNDDFLPIHAGILERLNTQDDKGLVLLHGKPGTGKTTYLRYLAGLVKKRVIFLSPEIVQRLGAPNFTSIVRDYENSIIIVEDAESVVMDRKAGGNEAISNLLNMTDGLLADCFKLQFICTFNTPLASLDKALLRKGRLIARYEFNELEEHKVAALAHELNIPMEYAKPMVLTDVFNYGNDIDRNVQEKTLGFMRNVS
jgi:hypothetical protein